MLAVTAPAPTGGRPVPTTQPSQQPPSAVTTRRARGGRLFPAIVAVLDWLCLAIIVAAVLVFLDVMLGCAVGKAGDGSDVVGFRLDDAAVQHAGQLGTVIGGIFGGPAGAALGGTAATAIAGLLWGSRQRVAGEREGERRGWDEAVGKPGEAAPAVRAVGGVSVPPQP